LPNASSTAHRAAVGPVTFRARLDGWTLTAVVIAALVAIPVVVVMASVLVPAGEVWRHLADTVLTGYVVNTLVLMLGVGVGTLVIGVATAWLVTMCRFPGHAVFEWALLLPLAVPTYAIAFTYGGLFEFAGPVQTGLRETFGWGRSDYWFPEVRSLGGAILVMSMVLYPYVYLLARAAFLEQSVCVIEVSRTLGRGPWRGFLEVALPLARPAIAGGVALALMEALSDFGAVKHLAVATFTTGIFRTWFGLGEPIAAAQLSAVLLLFVLALIVLERGMRGGRKFHHTSRRYRALPRYELSGGRALVAFLACFSPIFLGFLLPGGQLVAWTAETAHAVVNFDFLVLAGNSIMLAAVAATVAVGAALLLAYGQRLKPGPVLGIAARVASMGYAVPGAVIAVGVLLPFAWLDNQVDGMMRSTFGVSTGLILSGTLVALVFGYLVRFLAISFNTVEASLGKVTPTMDGAARTLGLGAGATLRRVHVPIVSGSLLTAGLLVFVDVMKELPATLIMRPFNFNTLAVRAFELAEDEQLAESAPAALSIVGVGIVPVILLTVAIARSRPGHRSD
jgi:iron(III) transport system permease protein